MVTEKLDGRAVSSRRLLTMKDAKAIRREKEKGKTRPELAKKYGVSEACIGMILRGETYKDAA